ncbi:MAG: PspC domain-containing protein [Bacteroidales bacterium]|nr:MAG: PspC domain-containing protein [Bacteroidales bacterium]
MKKAVQINIGGRYFHIDEDAYQVLNEYLDSLRAHFEKEKEGGSEIIEDIEQRMTELFTNRLTDSKQVISIEDVREVIKILGRIEDFEFIDEANESGEEEEEEEKEEGEGEEKGEKETTFKRKENRRLYRDPDNSYLGGVAGGLGAYFNIDPLWIRLVFVALIFANGFGVILYFILWVIVPKARTTAQKLQMKGEPVTIQNIEKSISDEYHKVKRNIHKIKDSEKFQKTQDVFSDILNGIGLLFKALVKLIIYIIGIAFIIAGFILIVGLGISFFTRFNWFDTIHWPQINFPDLSQIFIDPVNFNLMTICIIILVFVPLLALIYGGIKLIFNIRAKSVFLRATALTAWILALILLITLVFIEGENFAFEASGSSTHSIKDDNYSTLYLDMKERYDLYQGITVYSIFDFDIYYNRSDEKILGKPELDIVRGYKDNPQLTIKKYTRNVSMQNADSYLDKLEYEWEQNDSILFFDHYYALDKEQKWRFPKVELILKIPEDQVIHISEGMEDILDDVDNMDFYSEDDMVGKSWIMTRNGLKLFKNQAE